MDYQVNSLQQSYAKTNTSKLASKQLLNSLHSNKTPLQPGEKTYQMPQVPKPEHLEFKIRQLHELYLGCSNQNKYLLHNQLKQNIPTNGIRSPFRKINENHKLGKLNISQTPKHSIPKDFFAIQTGHQQSRKWKCHRKKLSTDLDEGYDLDRKVSFKLLLDNRCKTTKNLANQTCLENDDKAYPVYLNNFKIKEPKGVVLAQEWPFESIRNRKDLRCSNNDGKEAKYRIISGDSPNHGHLYYCSRCTILLVQQGFVLEEITPIQSKKQDKSAQKEKECIMQLGKQVNTMIMQLRYSHQHEKDKIDGFYEKLKGILCDYQQKDLKIIEAYYQQAQDQLRHLLERISQAVRLIDKGQSEAFKNCVQEISQDRSQIKLSTLKVQLKTTHSFAVSFQKQFRPIFASMSPTNQLTSCLDNTRHLNTKETTEQNQAMRFSFEALISELQDKNRKKDKNNGDGLGNKQRVDSCESVEIVQTFVERAKIRVSTDASSPTFKNI